MTISKATERAAADLKAMRELGRALKAEDGPMVVEILVDDLLNAFCRVAPDKRNSAFKTGEK